MDDSLLAFVTNLDGQVFALRNLPEEVVAVLFAYYSRSRDDLRTNLRKLLEDKDLAVLAVGEPGRAAGPAFERAQDRARAFHEKWVVGYGHASVAEHGVVHLAVERCSIVAAKAIEEARLAAYTEKSTRYVQFGEDTLVTDIGLPASAGRAYELSARASLRSYTSLVERTADALASKHPVPDGTAPKAHANALRAHALDLLRGLLPAGVPTNLGLTVNGRVLEQHLSKLLGSPLSEVRALAGCMRDAGREVLPTLLKYTEPRAHRSRTNARVAPHAGRTTLASGGMSASGVRLIDAPESGRALRTLATSVLVDTLQYAWSDAWASCENDVRALEIVRAYLADRDKHDAPGRALEQVVLRFEVVCDYGAWRDLQRHRLLSASTPSLGTHEGYWLSDELGEIGVRDVACAALDAARQPYVELAASHPWEAQYVVPLAYRVRYVAQANLREVFHLVELRSARQGHESYRNVAIGIADRTIEALPFVAEFLRVDRNRYAYARH